MSIFKDILNMVDIVDVAKALGLNLDRSNKCCCPLHHEKTASFSVSKNRQLFNCFGCGASGDAITLVSKVLKIRPIEACKWLNYTFNLGFNFDGSLVDKKAALKLKEEQRKKEAFKRWENDTYIKLCNYYQYCKKNNLYNEEAKIGYFIDLFFEGTYEDKIWFYQNNKKTIKKIENF